MSRPEESDADKGRPKRQSNGRVRVHAENCKIESCAMPKDASELTRTNN